MSTRRRTLVLGFIVAGAVTMSPATPDAMPLQNVRETLGKEQRRASTRTRAKQHQLAEEKQAFLKEKRHAKRIFRRIKRLQTNVDFMKLMKLRKTEEIPLVINEVHREYHGEPHQLISTLILKRSAKGKLSLFEEHLHQSDLNDKMDTAVSKPKFVARWFKGLRWPHVEQALQGWVDTNEREAFDLADLPKKPAAD